MPRYFAVLAFASAVSFGAGMASAQDNPINGVDLCSWTQDDYQSAIGPGLAGQWQVTNGPGSMTMWMMGTPMTQPIASTDTDTTLLEWRQGPNAGREELFASGGEFSRLSVDARFGQSSTQALGRRLVDDFGMNAALPTVLPLMNQGLPCDAEDRPVISIQGSFTDDGVYALVPDGNDFTGNFVSYMTVTGPDSMTGVFAMVLQGASEGVPLRMTGWRPLTWTRISD